MLAKIKKKIAKKATNKAQRNEKINEKYLHIEIARKQLKDKDHNRIVTLIRDFGRVF